MADPRAAQRNPRAHAAVELIQPVPASSRAATARAASRWLLHIEHRGRRREGGPSPAPSPRPRGAHGRQIGPELLPGTSPVVFVHVHQQDGGSTRGALGSCSPRRAPWRRSRGSARSGERPLTTWCSRVGTEVRTGHPLITRFSSRASSPRRRAGPAASRGWRCRRPSRGQPDAGRACSHTPQTTCPMRRWGRKRRTRESALSP